MPEVAVPKLEGEQGRDLHARLEALATAEALLVRRGHERFAARSEMMGFLDPEQRAIYLREASMRQMTKTLAHELAHHFGYTERDLEPFESKEDPFGDDNAG